MNKIIEEYNETNEFGRLFNMTYDIIKPGKIIYKLLVTKELLATSRAMHGGALAGLMDAVVGVSALSVASQKEKVVSTVEFKINYLKPVLEGDVLEGVGTVISEGNRIIVCKGEIFNQDKEMVAVSTATLNAYPSNKLKE